jgi:hypothetical protein
VRLAPGSFVGKVALSSARHQLLREYIAARRLAKESKPELVHVEWAADKVSPMIEETLAGLANGDPLPPRPQTGWEETTLTAAPMAKDPEAFIRDLIPYNLPLAGRRAASTEVKISDDLKNEIQEARGTTIISQRAPFLASSCFRPAAATVSVFE